VELTRAERQIDYVGNSSHLLLTTLQA